MSRISDEEMARINIESSAALGEWIELRRTEAGAGLYGRLVDRAGGYLPMPQRTATIRVGPFPALAIAEIGDQLVRAVDPHHLARVRADAKRHSTRLFANALGYRHAIRGCKWSLSKAFHSRWRPAWRRQTVAPEQIEFLSFGGRRVEAAPTAGRTSTGGGALLLREVARRLGL
jgi:hypothetical protein